MNKLKQGMLLAVIAGLVVCAACSKAPDTQLDVAVVAAPDVARPMDGPVLLHSTDGQCAYFAEEVAATRSPRNWTERVVSFVRGGALDTWQVHVYESDCIDKVTHHWARAALDLRFESLPLLRPGDRVTVRAGEPAYVTR
ncbi:hypothetical protein AB4Y45_33160 [Paraburkholderia sp. EG287A]|uniref:hypothetical protein n=1 Tax=Paraburkholderia sp. EG287A TaxID=3237012 RepID=UPI0034D31EF8